MYIHLQKVIDEDKEQLYKDLQSVVEKVPKSDIAIILGDLNGKLGKERIYSNVTGKRTYMMKQIEMVKCYMNLLLQII